VAIVHAQYVGEDGTVRIKGLTFADVEQAKSADVLIVTCEEIVPRSFIRLDPDQNTLPPFFVDAIVKAPYGAHPTACFGFYDYDPKHLYHYKKVAKDDDSFKEYLDEWVYGVADHEEYLNRVGAAAPDIKANLCRLCWDWIGSEAPARRKKDPYVDLFCQRDDGPCCGAAH
jgi:glutaconate CoA-transferase subunit A